MNSLLDSRRLAHLDSARKEEVLVFLSSHVFGYGYPTAPAYGDAFMYTRMKRPRGREIWRKTVTLTNLPKGDELEQGSSTGTQSSYRTASEWSLYTPEGRRTRIKKKKDHDPEKKGHNLEKKAFGSDDEDFDVYERTPGIWISFGILKTNALGALLVDDLPYFAGGDDCKGMAPFLDVYVGNGPLHSDGSERGPVKEFADMQTLRLIWVESAIESILDRTRLYCIKRGSRDPLDWIHPAINCNWAYFVHQNKLRMAMLKIKDIKDAYRVEIMTDNELDLTDPDACKSFTAQHTAIMKYGYEQIRKILDTKPHSASSVVS